MTTALRLFNSLTRKLEEFEPVHSGEARVYSCGPTVYNYPHIGNMRAYVFADVLGRTLSWKGYKLTHIINITDVGHLTDDADAGEDKLEKAAAEKVQSIWDIARHYTEAYWADVKALNIREPAEWSVATDYVAEMIDFAKSIADKHCYELEGGLYFDVSTVADYGRLARAQTDEGESRIDPVEGKRNAADFAIWRKTPPGETRQMEWDSPWGRGAPGWHLECTAMSSKYLGETFDIHGGGMDLKFPHHECEIAQAEASTGKSPVNYWLHANMLTLNGKKMSKSTGNNIYPSEIFNGGNNILSKAYSPAVVRFFMMQAHYTSILDLSDEALLASEKGYNRLMEAMGSIDRLETGEGSDFDVSAWKQKCYDAMNDDFNTPILIAHLFDAVKQINLIKEGHQGIDREDRDQLRAVFNAMVHEVLGLEVQLPDREESNVLGGVMELLIQLRNDARADKDFTTSDKIRDRLIALGIQLKDNKDGTSYSLK